MTSDSVEPITLWPEDTARPRHSRRADARANEEAILAAAVSLFAAEGLSAVTMSAIAGEAKIGKGTLYRAFANKGELCLALMDDDLRCFQEETLMLFSEGADDSPLALLGEFLRRMVRFMDGHAALMCEAENHGVLRGRTEINQTSLHDWFRSTVRRLLQRAAVVGEVGRNADLDYLAEAVLAPLNPKLIQHQLREQGLAVELLSDRLVRFVMMGVRG